MQQYELMVILDPEVDERTVAPSLDKFLNVVRNDGGTVENVEPWLTHALDSGERIMGLGHRVYKAEDPRAEILREMARTARLLPVVASVPVIRCTCLPCVATRRCRTGSDRSGGRGSSFS